MCLSVVLCLTLVSCANDNNSNSNKNNNVTPAKKQVISVKIENACKFLLPVLISNDEEDYDFENLESNAENVFNNLNANDDFDEDSDGEAFYKFMYAGIAALYEVSKIDKVEANKLYFSETISDEQVLELSSTENFTVSDYVTKIEKIYIEQVSTNIIDRLKIYIWGRKNTFETGKCNSILFVYDIEFFNNEKQINFTMRATNTNSNGEVDGSGNDNSSGKFFSMNYNSKDKILQAYKFNKNSHFDINNENSYIVNVNNHIDKYFSILYFTSSGFENISNSKTDEGVQNKIKEEILAFISNIETISSINAETEEQGEDAGEEISENADAEENKNEDIFYNLLYIFNADSPKDFMGKLK